MYFQGVAWRWYHTFVFVVEHAVAYVACIEKGYVLEYDELTADSSLYLTDMAECFFPFHIVDGTVCLAFCVVVLIVIVGILKNSERESDYGNKEYG